MKEIVIKSNALSQWHEVVQEAQHNCAHELNEDCESYLVFLLMRFLGESGLADRVMAEGFLASAAATGTAKQQMLQEVGDTCLMLSGLFPGRAERRNVSVDYYVGLGQVAYDNLSCVTPESLSKLYINLRDEFVALMDVLQAIRAVTAQDLGLSPLQAQALWEQTGSHMAGRQLEQSLTGVNLAELKRLGGLAH